MHHVLERTPEVEPRPYGNAVAGVYGLRVHGLPAATGLLPAGDGPTVTMLAGPTVTPTGLREVDADHVAVDLRDDSHRLLVDRSALRAVYHGPRLSPDEIVHPYFGAVAAIVQRWYGCEVLHAGAFVANGQTWAVVGPREAGKSTLLAGVACASYPVLADDLVITDGHHVFAGPRCLDLRHPPAHGMAGSFPVSSARGRTRWRVTLPPVEPSLPVGGWFFLGWGDQVSAARIAPHEVLGRLARWRAWPELGSDPGVLLSLAALPAWRIARPRALDRVDETLDLLLQAASR